MWIVMAAVKISVFWTLTKIKKHTRMSMDQEVKTFSCLQRCQRGFGQRAPSVDRIYLLQAQGR